MNSPQNSVLCVYMHTPTPMGQQVYEGAIMNALDVELAGSELRIERASYGPGKSSADYRLPQRILNKLPMRTAAAAAYWQRPKRLVHRFDLRIPPTLIGPEIATAHDLPAARFRDEGTLPSWTFAGGARDACVIVPSQFAADEINELIGPRRVEVIPYGVSGPFKERTSPGSLCEDRFGLTPGTYFVHAAGVTDRKNLKGLAAAWERVTKQRKDLHLVLCGPPSPRRTSLFAHLPNTLLPGRLPAEEIADLMSCALGVVVPSIYEGFGLPALEGMAVGTPVIAVDRGALPEVCGGAAVLTEPDGESIATAILDLAADRNEQERLREEGLRRAAEFSWEVAAKEHARVYREVLAEA